jgi:integrase
VGIVQHPDSICGVTAGLTSGKLFRCVCTVGTAWGEGMTEKVVWHVVKQYATKVGLPKIAPHDLRRSCARLCHIAGCELEQIQFLLGHVSVQTTENTSDADSACGEL